MGWLDGWRRRLAMAGTFALLAGAMVLPQTFATGDTAETFGSSGILRLHLGAQDYLRFDPSNGADPTQTNISSSACKVSLSNGSLVALTHTPTSSGAAVGLKDDGLGVKVVSEGSGTPCGQVNGTSQALTISLAGILGSKVIDRAELDVEFKFNAKVKADMYLDGGLVGTRTFDCTKSDCGPDSGSGDNFRLQVTDLVFDAIRLSVDPSTPSGAFSLEGGADGTTPGVVGSTLATDKNDSIFRISGAEGTLTCGGQATETGASGEPDATLQRANATGCNGAILYSLDSSADEDSQDVHFLKDISDHPDDSFFVKIDWETETATYPLTDTLVDEGNGFYTPDWCDGTYLSPALSAGSVADGEHWCVRKETAESAGTGQVHRITEYYGVGDPLFTLPKLGASG